MMISDLGVCLDWVLDDPRAFWCLIVKVGSLRILKFFKYGLERILVISMSELNSETGNSSVMSFKTCTQNLVSFRVV